MSKQNIVIIGGTACGPKAAARARRCDPNAHITIIEQGSNLSTATCGLPYYVAGVINSQSALVARGLDFFKDVMDIDVLIQTQASVINPKTHEVELLDLKTSRVSRIGYDKLVLATGSLPVVPNLQGKELNGIFTLTKIGHADAIRHYISANNAKKAVIIGAGLIGLEMAEAFASQGLKVTIIEALNWLLPALLDFEVAAYVEKHLRAKGVELLFGQRVSGFEGAKNGAVHKITTANNELETNVVLLSVGVKPNVKLAKDAGLTIGSLGGISVNQFLQTSNPDIYAGGDCVENVNLITRKNMLAPLGSTANKHGRIIGTNITGGRETFPGILGTAIAKVFDYNVGRVGLSETQAREAGYDVVTSLVPSFEHATYYPGSKEILVKLLAEKSTGRLLGGQVVGSGDAAKRIDVLATALAFGARVDDLANLDLAYAPPYNSAMDPLHNAANVILNKQSGLAKALTPMDTKSKLDNQEDFVLLDVRSPIEWKDCHFEAPQAKLIPLGKLRANLESLSKDAEIVTFCRSSVRAYQAQRILEGAGFKNVKFLDGSIAAWPYEVCTKPSSDEKEHLFRL
ncbi:MAG: pyridine nucleotide-disulfide oxidoreductase [Chloroflexi bacterium]|nr:pyridine nucleotide-disulfide oxidoreductase [Chloroflexota bacterium]